MDIMKEFFKEREELYHMRKEFLLAQLQRDYEILLNKVKFIQAVIAGEIKINKQKRKSIMQQCVKYGLKTWTQLQEIMLKFIKSEKVKSRAIRNTSNEENAEKPDNGDESEEGMANDETKDDEMPSKEYDYLLSMPLWSLTEERVDDLIKQMNNKKNEHDSLQKRHIFDLWNEDLTNMLKVLTQIEEKEE